MKQIPLTQGKVALVDDVDFKELSKHKWCAYKRGSTFYAARNQPLGNGKRKTIRMHRQIMDALGGVFTDHANHDGLDNQRSNLRSCTNSENQRNRLPQRGGTSEYKGVSWNKAKKKWVAGIQHNNKVIHLGCFNSEREAAKTYDKKAKELFGEFANPNFKEAKL